MNRHIATKKKGYIYALYGRINGKPAGFCGSYNTKKQAEDAQRYEKVPTIIKREKVS